VAVAVDMAARAQQELLCMAVLVEAQEDILEFLLTHQSLQNQVILSLLEAEVMEEFSHQQMLRSEHLLGLQEQFRGNWQEQMLEEQLQEMAELVCQPHQLQVLLAHQQEMLEEQQI
jgi:hypothetical protein